MLRFQQHGYSVKLKDVFELELTSEQSQFACLNYVTSNCLEVSRKNTKKKSQNGVEKKTINTRANNQTWYCSWLHNVYQLRVHKVTVKG